MEALALGMPLPTDLYHFRAGRIVTDLDVPSLTSFDCRRIVEGYMQKGARSNIPLCS